MEADALQKLKAEYDQHKTNRAGVEATWDQIEKFVDPLGSGRLALKPDTESEVLWKRTDVWDFTAIEASLKLKATIHGTVTNPAVQWFSAEFRDTELQRDKEAREALEENIGRVYQALQDSDFNTEIASNDGDLVNYGNGFIVQEPKNDAVWEGFDFTSVPVREAYKELDSYGFIRKFFRRLSWTARQIVERCKGENVPEKIVKEAETPEGATVQHEVVFCIFPREDGGSGWEGGRPVVLAPERRPWGSVYFLAENAEQCGKEGGYYEMPAFWSPWEETAGSEWGHGIGGLVLPTVKLLNALWEMYLGAAEKAVDPPAFVSDRAGVSAVDLGAGKWTVAKGDLDKIFRVIESGAKFQVTEVLLAQLQAMVRGAFHADELHLKDSPAMTATEAAIRFEVMNRVMGSVLARIQSKQLIPIIRLTMSTLQREGRLKPWPPQVLRKRGDINIVFLGPLSRAQRTDEVGAIERGFAFVAQARKLGFEEAADAFDAAAATREVFKRLGIPASCQRSEAESKKMAEERAQAMAAARQAEIARAQGEAVEQAGAARMAMQEAGAVQTMDAQPTPLISPVMGS